MTVIKRFEINTAGRDFAVGDIHGHFTKLQAALNAVSFEPKADRLFSVGDLVDRGPESDLVLEWLAKPWFHAVQGNHELMAVKYTEQVLDGGFYLSNGGSWLMGLSTAEQAEYRVALAELPIAIEVLTAAGIVGIVHADCPCHYWQGLVAALGSGPSAEMARGVAQWSRNRVDHQNEERVAGVRAVVVGHTPLRRAAWLGNVLHIDTGAWLEGHFTLVNLETLECHPPIDPKLVWDQEKDTW